MMLLITAKDNASIKYYRHLTGSAKTRKKEGAFVLEGLRLVQDALKNGADLQQIFFTEKGLEKWQSTEIHLPESVKAVQISDAVAETMTQTEHSQGVFAIAKMPEAVAPSAFFKPDGKYAVLYNLQDPGNAGMILRTADALGLDGVVYCASCDIYSPKVVRATMGSLFRVPVCVNTEAEEVLQACQVAGISSYAAVVNGNAQKVGEISFAKGSAVWIGNEGNGLPETVSNACDYRVTIPMHGTIESLNAAMAAGIILWEAVRKG